MPEKLRVLTVRRGGRTYAFHKGLCLSWEARSGRPSYTYEQTRLYPGERYHVRHVPVTHQLGRAFLARENPKFYE